MLTEVVKIIYPKCSEAFFLDADTWHLEMMTPLQRHCQRMGLGGSSAVLQCGPEVIVGTQLNTPEVCSDGKGSQQLLNCATRGTAQRSREGIAPLCVALTRPHPNTESSFGTWHWKDMDKLEGAQGRAPRVVGLDTCPMRRHWGS